MMAESFAIVRFPIIPVIHQDKNGQLSILRNNSKLITPRDFDHSPYFDVIKYPVLDFDELGIYRKLPWDQTSVHCNTIGDCYISSPDEIEKLTPVKSVKTIKRDNFLQVNESVKDTIKEVTNDISKSEETRLNYKAVN